MRSTVTWAAKWTPGSSRSAGSRRRQPGRPNASIGPSRSIGGALDLVRGVFLAEDPYEERAMEARGEFRERRLSVFSRLSECLALADRVRGRPDRLPPAHL